MTEITVTDLFAGAGGSTTGAIQVPGVTVRIAANHWQTACDIHALNHQDTDHAIVDLHQERPAFFPKTTMLWASPECTKWSPASGEQQPAIEEGLFEDPLSDEAKNRSRLLMFDVLRFIEHHRYRVVVVENVVDIATRAKYRTAWDVWRSELRALGYRFRVVSLNSMHAQAFGAPAPQSRDRLYIVAWPEGATAPDIDRILRPKAWCSRCSAVVESVQSWKPGRSVGKYRQQYAYCCSRCAAIVEPGYLPAAAAIDWSLPGTRIGDRSKPLAEKTLARIAAGVARYWGPLTVEAAGNTYDAAAPTHPRHGDPDAYMRSWPVDEPLRALHTTNSKALAVPVEGRDGKDAAPVELPMRTQTTRAETGLAGVPLVAEFYGTSTARPVTEPAGAFTAGGNHHGLVTRHYGSEGGNPARHTTPTAEELRTLTANGGNMSLAVPPFVTQFRQRDGRNLDPSVDPLRTIVADGAGHALVQDPFILDRRFEYRIRDVGEPMPTLTANDTAKALVHRMNADGAGMTTPAHEELRTLTGGGTQALLQQPRTEVTAKDLAAAREVLPHVLFRMFQPHEVAAGMAFPDDYQWQPPDRAKPISNRDLVRAAGNAVTPPAARDLIAVCVESLLGDIHLTGAAA